MAGSTSFIYRFNMVSEQRIYKVQSTSTRKYANTHFNFRRNSHAVVYSIPEHVDFFLGVDSVALQQGLLEHHEDACWCMTSNSCR